MADGMTEVEGQVPDAVDEMLDETRKQLESKLEELRPAVEASRKIEGILSSWDRKTAGSRRGRTSTERAGRGDRPAEFIALVTENPGITVSQAVERMSGINKNYAYRIAKEQVDAGKVRKDGSGYFPVS